MREEAMPQGIGRPTQGRLGWRIRGEARRAERQSEQLASDTPGCVRNASRQRLNPPRKGGGNAGCSYVVTLTFLKAAAAGSAR
jgi:hypothetical protein